MALVFITGSTDGLGRAAAEALLSGGHRVVLHARSAARAEAVRDLSLKAAAVVVGDLRSAGEVEALAAEVNALGAMDAVIYNAGVYREASRAPTPEGHAVTLAVNTLAPYLLAAKLLRPSRQIFLSSGLHRGGAGSLSDLDWTGRRWNPDRAYAESKLHAVALAFGLARRWPGVLSNAVDPGWVRTRMGGSGAPLDLGSGQRTQTWLATSCEDRALVSGGYWRDLQEETPAPEASDPGFQDALLDRLAELTGVSVP